MILTISYFFYTHEVNCVSENRRRKLAPNSKRGPFVFLLSFAVWSSLSQLFHVTGEGDGVFGEKHFSTGVVGNGNSSKEFGKDILGSTLLVVDLIEVFVLDLFCTTSVFSTFLFVCLTWETYFEDLLELLNGFSQLRYWPVFLFICRVLSLWLEDIKLSLMHSFSIMKL